MTPHTLLTHRLRINLTRVLADVCAAFGVHMPLESAEATRAARANSRRARLRTA